MYEWKLSCSLDKDSKERAVIKTTKEVYMTERNQVITQSHIDDLIAKRSTEKIERYWQDGRFRCHLLALGYKLHKSKKTSSVVITYKGEEVLEYLSSHFWRV